MCDCSIDECTTSPMTKTEKSKPVRCSGNKGVVVSFRLSADEARSLTCLMLSRPRVGAGTPHKFARHIVLDVLSGVHN